MRPFGDREKGWPRDAREGMGHPDAGDARWSFGAMRAVRAGVAVVAVLACVVATSAAWAHDEGYGSACTSSNRISHRASTCVHGWWDNTPPASTGAAGGSTFGAELENSCGDYGNIFVHVDIIAERDNHFHFESTDNGKKRLERLWADVRQISCCWDASDLCYVKEVEAENGQIVRHTSGRSWVYENVATHQQRYDLCQSYPDIIYCRKNPSGDALTPPAPPPPLAEVSLQDCYDNFEQSLAADFCDNFSARPPTGTRGRDESERRTVELTNGMCQQIYADCQGRHRPLGGSTSNHADDLALADVVNIHWCNWTVAEYRRHPTRHHIFLGGTDEYWALLAETCPESTVQYVDENGNPTDPP